VERAQAKLALDARTAAAARESEGAAARARRLTRLDEQAEAHGLKPHGQPRRLDGVEARGGYFAMRPGGRTPESDSRRDGGQMMGGAASFTS